MNAPALLDDFVATPLSTFEFDPASAAQTDVLLTADPVALYRRLLRDQESEPVLLAARRVLHGFLSRSARGIGRLPADADAIAERVGQFREVIAAIIEDVATPDAQKAVLRQRAPLALLGGCWLDAVAQPASRPATVVHRLVEQRAIWQGDGNPRRGLHHLRQQTLEAAGVYLPEIAATDFMRMAEARPLTALHGAFYLSLARLPANFLPEVVGVHYVIAALGVDDLLLGTRPMLPESELRSVLAKYLCLASARPELRTRVVRAAELALNLELENVGMLAGLAAWLDGRTPGMSLNRIGAREAAAWRAALAAEPPADVVLRRADVPDDRQFFHRLVNIENYPNTIDVAREHAIVVLQVAEEAFFEHGASGVLTDASWFEYTPDALRERVDQICRVKLRAEGAAEPRAAALGAMIDGAWTCRIGNVGRSTRRTDGMLSQSHDGETGRRGFVNGDGLPEHRYGLPIHQLCLSLFPDSCYDEILGFHLGITMFGHLPVDNASFGHARWAADTIIGYLDDVARTCGADAVRTHWRRIWRGYASFAYVVEPEPLGSVGMPAPAKPARTAANRAGTFYYLRT